MDSSLIPNKIKPVSLNTVKIAFRTGKRRVLSRLLRLFFRVFTRTEVKGLEHIPDKGHFLVLPNHLSNLDAPLILACFPRQLEMVGPGDFKMRSIKDICMRLYGLTYIKRGYNDLSGMKSILTHLRNKRNVLLFPLGGMWEKRIFELKEGAAYFSQATATPCIPVGISGAYTAARDLLRLKRPRITVEFGRPLPPVPGGSSRAEKNGNLELYSKKTARDIFGLLNNSEQALYKNWEKAVYDLQIDFQILSDDRDMTGKPDMSSLAELMIKPNLFRPMYNNSPYSVKPFRVSRFFRPSSVAAECSHLIEMLDDGRFRRYIPYRMGEKAQEDILASLKWLREKAEGLKGTDNYIRLTAKQISMNL